MTSNVISALGYPCQLHIEFVTKSSLCFKIWLKLVRKFEMDRSSDEDEIDDALVKVCALVIQPVTNYLLIRLHLIGQLLKV